MDHRCDYSPERERRDIYLWDERNNGSKPGTIGVSPGTTLTINAPNWSNTGLLDVNGGTVNLGGGFSTASVAGSRFARSGGTVNLTGALTNTGATLALDAVRGGWNLLSSSTIVGGTVQTDPGLALTVTATGNNPVLNGVTLAAGSVLDVGAVNGAIVDAVNGFTINGTVLVGNAAGTNSGTLNFPSTQTVGGTGAIVLGGSGNNLISSHVVGAVTNFTITLASPLRIRGKSARIAGSFTSGGGATYLSSATIQADVAGGSILIDPTTFTNSGAITVDATQTFTINPLSWSNTGVMTLAGGTMNLGGAFTGASVSGPTRFIKTSGTVNLTGTITNTGNTLPLDGSGNWNLTGTIIGGTIATLNGANFQATNNTTAALNGVTIAANTDFIVTDASVAVTNGLTVNGRVTLGGTQVRGLFFNNTNQTLGGSGEIKFTGSGMGIWPGTTAITLTIGSSLLIHGSNVNINNVGATVINQATITADLAGTSTINLGAGSNSGTIQATVPGSTLFANFPTTITTTTTGTVRATGGATVSCAAAIARAPSPTTVRWRSRRGFRPLHQQRIQQRPARELAVGQ